MDQGGGMKDNTDTIINIFFTVMLLVLIVRVAYLIDAANHMDCRIEDCSSSTDYP
jgi:hypothetical protein